MSGSIIFPPLIVFEIPIFAALLAEMGYSIVGMASQAFNLGVESKQLQKCNLVFKTKGGVEVGLISVEGGGFEIVCNEEELEQVEGISKIEMKDQLVRNYTRKKIEDELKQHGFTIVEEQAMADNTIKIRVRRWN